MLELVSLGASVLDGPLLLVVVLVCALSDVELPFISYELAEVVGLASLAGPSEELAWVVVVDISPALLLVELGAFVVSVLAPVLVLALVLVPVPVLKLVLALVLVLVVTSALVLELVPALVVVLALVLVGSGATSASTGAD